MINCFVAINLSINDKLLNDNKFPIVFYWDGQSDIVKDIKNNGNFMNMITSNCFNIHSYSDAKLYLTYINDDKFDEKVMDIEEMFPFEEITTDTNFMLGYICDILLELYGKVFKNDYPRNDLDLIDFKYEIKDMTKRIQDYYINKSVTSDTIINYVYSQMNEKDKLIQKNKDYLIKTMKNIIEEP